MNTPAPVTTPRHRSAQSWARFRAHRRGWISLWMLVALYGLSLIAELICNDKPLLMRFNGRTFLPAFVNYTQDDILANDVHTRMSDYTAFLANRMPDLLLVRAPFRSGAQQIFSASDIEPYRRLELTLSPYTHAAAVQLAPDFSTRYTLGETNHFAALITGLAARCANTPELQRAIAARLANKPSPALDIPLPDAILSLPPFSPRPQAPSSVRLFLRSHDVVNSQHQMAYPAQVADVLRSWQSLSPTDCSNVLSAVQTAQTGDWVAPVPVFGTASSRAVADVSVSREAVSWPFRPVPGHPMGFDSAGRDVFARLFYALRTSMTFGLALVCLTMILGIAAGAVQGYFAGWIDITGQRFTEIWSALPFLYVIILLGNTLGRSFGLLLICYAAFNWIGIALYIRAEFLRLRTRAFVDAARCQGLSRMRIMFRHILPNSLTPLITLFPFCLVGAIGSLAVLDYLGFGLPAGTPSWGELLNDAQSFRSAWWLILYPSLALFTVMILGVFIGEGLRDAFDPKPYSKME